MTPDHALLNRLAQRIASATPLAADDKEGKNVPARVLVELSTEESLALGELLNDLGFWLAAPDDLIRSGRLLGAGKALAQKVNDRN